MSQINLRLPDELKKMAERYARRYGYRSIQELAKESIRMRIGSDVVKGLSPKIKGEVSGKELISTFRTGFTSITHYLPGGCI